MQNFSNIETSVLKSMVSAHAAYYCRDLTQEEFRDCKESICLLQSELEARKNMGANFLVPVKTVKITAKK